MPPSTGQLDPSGKGRVEGEEQRRSRDLLRRAVAPHRSDPVALIGECRSLLVGGLDAHSCGSDEAGADRVHPNAPW